MSKPNLIVNPDKVKITDPLECETHNWTVNNMYDVVYKTLEGAKDENGFCIFVMSNEWKHPIWLSSKSYSLT